MPNPWACAGSPLLLEKIEIYSLDPCVFLFPVFRSTFYGACYVFLCVVIK